MIDSEKEPENDEPPKKEEHILIGMILLHLHHFKENIPSIFLNLPVFSKNLSPTSLNEISSKNKEHSLQSKEESK